MPKHSFKKATCLLLALCFSQLSSADTDNGASDPDAALVDNLQAMGESIQPQLPGLTPEEISVLRRLHNEQEAARQNPTPPKVTNRVIILNRGESPSIDIMERFDTTLVFADRHGIPLEITAFRISDEAAGSLLPLHAHDENTALVPSENEEGLLLPSKDGERGPIVGLIVTPKAPMRSTNITVMLRGQDFPIVATLTTRSSIETEHELAFIQEMRLSWTSSMPRSEELAGKFTGANGGSALSQQMVSLVQGVPDSTLDPVPLRGELSRQVTLWQDKVEDEWYMRVPEHIQLWNVSIRGQTRDGLRGYSVIRLNGAPPSLIGMTVNGRYQTVELDT